MLEIGQTIMYRHSVCIVDDIIENFKSCGAYYKLSPFHDNSLVIHVPIANAKKAFKPLLTKIEATQLLQSIPGIVSLQDTDKMIEATYKDLCSRGNHEDLIRIIKTTYSRNQAKIKKGLRRSERDKMYFNKAENTLYNELSAVLGKTVAEVRNDVIARIIS